MGRILRTQITVGILLSVLLNTLAVNAEEVPSQIPQKPAFHRENEFIHAAYVVGKRFKSRDELNETNFAQFNFIYVVAGPSWRPEDFDSTEASLMGRLVTQHSYPTGTMGEALVPELIARAHHEHVNVLLSLPGAGEFNPIAGDNGKRKLFADIMTAFAKKYDYDGIEIDWEETVDIDQHTALMTDFRKAFDAQNAADGTLPRKRFLITALQLGRSYSPLQARQLADTVDWVNLMTYDLGGGTFGDTPSHNTPLDGIRKALSNWQTFPRNKLCIGLANFGFIYNGISPGEKCRTSLKEQGRSLWYTELPHLLQSGWKESYDAKAQVPYYFSLDKTQFATIDNQQSLNKKVEWILSEHFRGIFWWEFHCDFNPPTAAQKYANHPLIDSVSATLDAHAQTAGFAHYVPEKRAHSSAIAVANFAK